MDDSVRELFDAACAAREHSYSPYSDYKVGAALRTVAGDVFAACNVENVAYPEGVCAEGGAISMMVAGSDGVPVIAEVVTVTTGDTPRDTVRRMSPEDPRVQQCLDRDPRDDRRRRGSHRDDGGAVARFVRSRPLALTGVPPHVSSRSCPPAGTDRDES